MATDRPGVSAARPLTFADDYAPRSECLTCGAKDVIDLTMFRRPSGWVTWFATCRRCGADDVATWRGYPGVHVELVSEVITEGRHAV